MKFNYIHPSYARLALTHESLLHAEFQCQSRLGYAKVDSRLAQQCDEDLVLL